MKVIYFIIFIGFLKANNHINICDIKYDEEFSIDNNKEGSYLSNNIYYFRLYNNNFGETKIQLKVNKDANINFYINVCNFNHFPDDNEIETQNNWNNLDSYTKEFDEKYDIYTYMYYKVSDVNYTVISFQNTYDISFLSISVHTEEDKRYNLEKYLYEISLNKKYEFDSNDIIKYNVNGLYLFILDNEKKENGMIKFIVNRESHLEEYSFVVIGGFERKPKTEDELEKNMISPQILNLNSKQIDDDYSIYVYSYDKISGANYIVIGLNVEEAENNLFTYLGVYVSDKVSIE